MSTRDKTKNSLSILASFSRLVSIFFIVVALSACGVDPSSNGDQNESSNGDLNDAASGNPTILIEPSQYNRLFIPRIVPEDGSNEIWRYMQRSSIFWFGRVDSRNNYIDVRVGYSDQFLMIRCAVFDQKIYDEAQDSQLSQWDSISLYLDLDGDEEKFTIDERSIRIDAQALRHGTERTYIYQGSMGVWVPSNIQLGSSVELEPDSINLSKTYRGGERDESRGWSITFFLGFDALGLTGPPLDDTYNTWRVAVISYDRDNLDGSVGGDPQYWPTPSLDDTDPSTWGRWQFLDAHFLTWSDSGSTEGYGQPSYTIQHAPEPFVEGTEQIITIRHGLDGDEVENASVGASEVLCSGDDSYNFGDGSESWGGNTVRNFFHIQNQADYSDWPCFAKIYVKFPLWKLPMDKVVVSARIILHHKLPTSAGDQGERSLIQVFPVANTLVDGQTPWTAANITWNNAPFPFENIAGTWVDRTGESETGWDNLPEAVWDVTRAVAMAGSDAHISFALSSADTEYHTGKSFVESADFEDWGDQTQRPTLEITIADPQ
jgi:hypothetical protein